MRRKKYSPTAEDNQQVPNSGDRAEKNILIHTPRDNKKNKIYAGATWTQNIPAEQAELNLEIYDITRLLETLLHSTFKNYTRTIHRATARNEQPLLLQAISNIISCRSFTRKKYSIKFPDSKTET
ncbi:hypothetical protein GWI33_020359 [Rhynchophorus ferrugineus]|uniref:Uncharacterized protein n=1 Tax=Rhynchophorus ferrugineus TaxID=354439 RepID=A0A834HUI5_RHYFE|nr:hypothetical protein GWI33_020359 [Rhynchophorus ferrugineus]